MSPRVNIEVPVGLHREAKAVAALEGKSLKDFVLEAVEDALPKKGASSGEGEVSR